MKIYYDDKYRCHVEQDAGGSYQPADAPFFDGKCRTLIEGYCYVPDGAGGESVYPWRDSDLLAMAQGAYEDALATLRADLQPQLDDVLVALVEV